LGDCKVTELGRVAAGTNHTCAIVEDARAAGVDGVTASSGNVRCWGDNVLGQLGAAFDRPFVGDDETPASLQGELAINFGRTVVQISAGFAHTCALFEEGGKVRCWGRRPDDVVSGRAVNVLGTTVVGLNSFGFVDPLTTGDVNLSEPAVQISAANGGDHTCAVLVSGKVSCWGANYVGQCGIGAVSPSVGGISSDDLPVVLLDPSNPNIRALQVSAGDEHSCALLSEAGRVTCWGAGYSGQLGYGEDRDRVAPQGSVAIGEPATQITAGYGHTCALLERGRVRCWGSNTFGTLGYGHALDLGDDETPAGALTIPRAVGSDAFLGGDALIGGGNVVQITSVADSQSVCARFMGGEVRCWGRNDQGQLGYGHTENVGDRFRPDTFRQIDGRPAGGDVSLGVDALGVRGFAVALAEGGRCAFVRPDGALGSAPLALYCWGDNTHAQLGLPLFFPAGGAIHTPVELGPVSWDQNSGTTPTDAGVSSSPTRALPAP
jgi:alpha-tubulin suppressor-like RCC1 family protein